MWPESGLQTLHCTIKWIYVVSQTVKMLSFDRARNPLRMFVVVVAGRVSYFNYYRNSNKVKVFFFLQTKPCDAEKF